MSNVKKRFQKLNNVFVSLVTLETIEPAGA